MTFFFDRCVGKRLPRALRELKPPFGVVSYFDEFPHERAGFNDIPDDKWLQLAGRNGWFVVTQDDKWHKEAIHISVIRQYEVGCFVLSGAQDPTWITAKLLLSKFDEILSICQDNPRPFLYHIERSGKIKARFDSVPSTDDAGVAG